MDCNIPGFPVLYKLPELAQTHVHWAGDAIQPSHSLSSPLLLPSVFPSIRVFSHESALHIRWPEYYSISPSSEYSWLISLRMDWLDLLAVQGTLKSLLQVLRRCDLGSGRSNDGWHIGSEVTVAFHSHWRPPLKRPLPMGGWSLWRPLGWRRCTHRAPVQTVPTADQIPGDPGRVLQCDHVVLDSLALLTRLRCCAGSLSLSRPFPVARWGIGYPSGWWRLKTEAQLLPNGCTPCFLLCLTFVCKFDFAPMMVLKKQCIL